MRRFNTEDMDVSRVIISVVELFGIKLIEDLNNLTALRNIILKLRYKPMLPFKYPPVSYRLSIIPGIAWRRRQQ